MDDCDDLVWADAYAGQARGLGGIFCLTFVREVDEAEALRRMGGLPDTIATRTPYDIGDLHNFDDGYPTAASVLRLGNWTVVFEPGGFEGAQLLAAMSYGTEAVSVLRHDYASPEFGYAVDGEVITQFDPTFPARRHGADPDRLLPRMRQVGFTMDDDHEFDDAIARSLRLARQLTGVLPTFEALAGPLTSAYVEPWFSKARKPAAERPGHDGPVDAVAEVRRITSQHDLTDTPGLSDALTSAERAESVWVMPDSPLGLHVRAWRTEARRAGWSLNDPGARYRMSDAERSRGYDLGWLVRALGAALQPDPAPTD